MLISTQKLFVKHNISKHTFHKQGSLQKVVTRSFVASRIFIFFKTSEEEGFWHLLGSIRIRRAAALKKSLVVMVPLANCDRSRPKWCSIRISDKECELFQGYQKGDLQVKIASVVNAICCMLLFVWPAICIFPLGHLKLFSRWVAIIDQRSWRTNPEMAHSALSSRVILEWTKGATHNAEVMFHKSMPFILSAMDTLVEVSSVRRTANLQWQWHH